MKYSARSSWSCCCRRKEWWSPTVLSRNEVAECQRRNSTSNLNKLWAFGLGGLNEWWRIDLLDTKVHKLDGSPHGDAICYWREREDMSVLLKRYLRKRKFRALSPPLYCLGHFPGQNGISHPHWMKICDETITVKLIYAPNKNSKFFLLQDISPKSV